MGPPKNDDISREKTILMTSLRTHRASAVSRPGLHYIYSPLALIGHCVLCLEPYHILADNFLIFGILYLFQFPIVMSCVRAEFSSGKKSSIYLNHQDLTLGH